MKSKAECADHNYKNGTKDQKLKKLDATEANIRWASEEDLNHKKMRIAIATIARNVNSSRSLTRQKPTQDGNHKKI